MRSFWFDPYLWVHLAGIAAVPLFLELCLLGLAIGEPLFPAWFELLFVGAIGILPILWMQWQRPFSIFSLVLLALKPSRLTEDQRRILQRFKLPQVRVLAALSALAMAGVLWQLYQIAPAVSPDLFPGIGRGLALLLAAIGFLGSNLFLQVPVSVLSVLLIQDSAFATTPPYATERIAQDFTIPGIRVSRILPSLLQPSPAPADPTPPVPAVQPASPVSVPPAASSSETPVAPPPLSPTPVELPKAEGDNMLNDMLNDDFDDDFDEDLDEDLNEASDSDLDAIEQAVNEEIEIIEDLSRAETAAIDPVENQTRDVMAMTDLEDEAMETIGQPSPPPQLTQLEESSDVTEEIVASPMPPDPPVSLKEPASPEVAEAIEPEPQQPIGDSEPIQPEATADLRNLTASSLMPPVEIVEDTTVAETLGSDKTNTDQPDTDETKPQQGAERPDTQG